MKKRIRTKVRTVRTTKMKMKKKSKEQMEKRQQGLLLKFMKRYRESETIERNFEHCFLVLSSDF